MFIYTSLLVGPMLPKQTQTLQYPYVDMVIISVSSTCSCSDPSFDELNKKVTIKYTAQDFPIHLMDRPSIVNQKFFRVKYHLGDPTKELEMDLSFKATVLNPTHHANRK